MFISLITTQRSAHYTTHKNIIYPNFSILTKLHLVKIFAQKLSDFSHFLTFYGHLRIKSSKNFDNSEKIHVQV